jgi:hypothetical protein
MPIAYERDDQRRRIVLTATGLVTRDEVIAQINRQIAEDAWKYGVLYDIRGGVQLPKTSDVIDFVELVRGLVARHGPRGPVAIVTDVPANEQRARMYVSLTEPSRSTVAYFNNIDDAGRWLDTHTPRDDGFPPETV